MAKNDKDEEQGKDEAEDKLSFDDDDEFEDRLSFDDDEDEIDDGPSFDDDEDEAEDDEAYDDEDEAYDDEDEDYDEEEDDEFEDDDFGAEEAADTDPYWWTPHAVLALLLLIGVLGAFGFFNKSLGFLAAVQPDHDQGHGEVATAAPVKHVAKPKTDRKVGMDKAPPPTGDVYGAKHLLVQYKGSKRAGGGITRTKEAAQKRAAEAAGKAAALAKANPKIADASKKFSKLVGEYSDEPGAARRGGDLGRFRKGSMVPQFQAAVEKLKRGGVSGVVETPFGYHVILRTF
jgi:parvulin-like peptidyl-prolyl isomerase